MSRRHPCPVCGKPDWCTVAADGGAICCMRTPGARLLHNGGWLHRPSGGAIAWAGEEGALAGGEAPRAPARLVDRVYRALLDSLELSPGHREHLLGPRRGLSPDAVARHGFRTLPRSGRAALCRAVQARLGVEPVGVPGFYRAAGRFGSYLTLAGPAGLVIPVRDLAGGIVGALVRCAGEGRRKYRWLSSAGRAGGARSGSPAHVARPSRVRDRGLWVTEGPLKADIAAERLGAVVVGIAGTAAWQSAGAVSLVVAARPPAVTIAFDQDGRPATARHAADLAGALAGAGLAVRLASWDPNRGKGIDDLLLGGGLYRTCPYQPPGPSPWRGPL